jgi:hypothetical protein
MDSSLSSASPIHSQSDDALDPSTSESAFNENLDERSKRTHTERLLHNMDKNSKKWAQSRISTLTTIKEAELEAKRYEVERLQAEYERLLKQNELIRHTLFKIPVI